MNSTAAKKKDYSNFFDEWDMFAELERRLPRFVRFLGVDLALVEHTPAVAMRAM